MSLTAKQLEIRRGGITGTDIRVLAGLDPYGRTAHDVFMSKVFGVDDFEETEAIELGMALEPIVIPRLARKVGLYALRIDPQKLTMVHPENDVHRATPDALLAKTAFDTPEATAQVKVCGLYTMGSWGKPEDGAEGVPDHVLVQAIWEAHVARVPRCFIGALIGTEVRAYTVDVTTSDMLDLTGTLCGLADGFWLDHVLPKKPPEIDGSEGSGRMLRQLFPRSRGTEVLAGPEAEDLAREYFAARKSAKAWDAEVERVKQLLTAVCAENEVLTGDGWRLRRPARAGYHVPAHDVAEGRGFDMRTAAQKKGHKAA